MALRLQGLGGHTTYQLGAEYSLLGTDVHAHCTQEKAQAQTS